MTSEALVFDEAPDSGFMAVPDDFADMLRAQGVRGNAYFPLVDTPVGRTVMSALNALSHVAQERPLLTGIHGLKSFAIQDNRLVLSHAYGDGGELRVRATPAAVDANAEVSAVAAPHSCSPGHNRRSLRLAPLISSRIKKGPPRGPFLLMVCTVHYSWLPRLRRHKRKDGH